jgi:hypothetical protein
LTRADIVRDAIYRQPSTPKAEKHISGVQSLRGGRHETHQPRGFGVLHVLHVNGMGTEADMQALSVLGRVPQAEYAALEQV